MPGDAAIYSQTPWVRRDSLVNKKSFSLNIFPTGSGPDGLKPDIEHKTQPSGEFAMAWADRNDFDMLESNKDDGYDFVSEDQWTLYATRFRWEAGKLCASNNLILMYKPLTQYLADRFNDQQKPVEDRIESATSDFHQAAAQLGADSFETRDGKEVVRAGKRSK